MTPPFNVMLSSAGRRVALLRIIEETLVATRQAGAKVVVTDAQTMAPAYQLAEHRERVPLCGADDYVDTVLALCKKHGVRLIIPTIDPELPIWAAQRSMFKSHGIEIMVSSPETIAIANDKRKTHQWLYDHGFPCFQQASIDEVLENPKDWEFPVFMKPYDGSRSIGARRVENLETLKHYYSPKMIVQALAKGEEYTVDAFIDSRGKCISVVPRKRLEVRDGEVSKGITVKVPRIIETVKEICERLPGAYGCLCVQVFYDKATDALKVVEINPRFGGGYPLTDAAGAKFVAYLLQDCWGETLPYSEDWKANFAMLRYDDAVFFQT